MSLSKEKVQTEGQRRKGLTQSLSRERPCLKTQAHKKTSPDPGAQGGVYLTQGDKEAPT